MTFPSPCPPGIKNVPARSGPNAPLEEVLVPDGGMLHLLDWVWQSNRNENGFNERHLVILGFHQLEEGWHDDIFSDT